MPTSTPPRRWSVPVANSRAEALMKWVVAALLAFWALPASAQELAPFKDPLFAYPSTLSTTDGGDTRVVDYREMRDINGRDEVPEKRVDQRYVDLGVRRVQLDLRLQAAVGPIAHVAVGARAQARYITIYLHGKGGSRKQGSDDFTFGGNFNRIKNLMVRNGGLYLAPDISDFAAGGAAEAGVLLAHYLERSPSAKLFIACGSMGGGLCWRLAGDKRVAPRLTGLLLLGSHWDEKFFSTGAFRERVPVFFGHGSRDPVYALDRQLSFFRSIRDRSPGYPSRFVVFGNGTHGTPIRMTDWRDTLNWMMAVRR